ncbi:MAG: site-specific integrase, partial [Bacillota bacterium]
MNNLIGEFMNYLSTERGLAMNTLELYGRDLRQYYEYLQSSGKDPLEKATRATVVAYLLFLQKQGKATATIARRLAALRSFYQFLLREKYVDKDPTANLESPKLEKRLPKVLTIKEVETL